MSWSKFWKFAVEVHPSLNRPEVTIITDQCKGSIGAIRKYVPHAFNFHCSYHRLSNVLVKCKGGSGKHSPHWVFHRLLACNNMASLETSCVRDLSLTWLSTSGNCQMQHSSQRHAVQWVMMSSSMIMRLLLVLSQ